MKHFVLAGLLTGLLAATGCMGYRPATSPYYTTYYNTYDITRNCYYHTSNVCCRRNYGFAGGSSGHKHHSGGGDHSSGGGHHGGGHSHSSSSHNSGSHGH